MHASLYVLKCLDNEHRTTLEHEALALAAAYTVVACQAPRLWRIPLTTRPSPFSRCVMLVDAGDAVEVELPG